MRTPLLSFFASLALALGLPTLADCSIAARAETGASCAAPCIVNFAVAPSGGQAPYTYAWVFGDGGTSAQQNPQHTYSAAGTYTAQVTIQSADHQTQACSQQVTVVAPVVIQSFAASQVLIQSGLSSTLSWATTGATSCSVDQGVGSVPVNGTKSVSPANTITYTLTATGAGGIAKGSVGVVVNHNPMISNFTATSPITLGNDSTISGATSDIDGDTVSWSLSIVSGSGTFTGPTSGTGVISSSITGLSVGTLSVRADASDGHGGTASATADITVNP